MDKSWMMENRMSIEYDVGVQSFVKFGLSHAKGIKELTFKFSGSAAGLFGDSFPFLGVDSIEGHNRVSGKGFLLLDLGSRLERSSPQGITRNATASCSLCAIGLECMSMDLEVTVRYVVVIGLDIDHGVWTGKDSESDFDWSTRLICASFGSTRLICAFYGTTRLLCKVRAQLGADRREAGRMREGHMDASNFLIASTDVFC
ncbi:hypothetical protein E5676_scaffold544G00030 [Cucumis melo var. makuwa]|uniref:Uncharacterized protein n=1 Tax=Cucumis melo var. makuwa TaxID=1194695 RepID=A0A5D3C8P1_CUCMM|nr:hypothetical protein E5676_scaffold544G00030 [Cucumis melo var. makuwa]